MKMDMDAFTLALCKIEKDSYLKQGEERVVIFNDGILIISLEDAQFNAKFITGKPYIVDANIIDKEKYIDEDYPVDPMVYMKEWFKERGVAID